MSRNQLGRGLGEKHSRQRKPSENMKGDWYPGALEGQMGKGVAWGWGVERVLPAPWERIWIVS